MAKALLASAIVLGAATLAIVLATMHAFRAELREQVTGMNDATRLASFEAALADEQLVTLGILAVTIVVAVLCIGSALVVLRREMAARRA